ncbi:LacI family DNA-binding transcriptional regulator [Paenibacillus sp. HB172176]|uniref:LacI family DNA-binding transcriptional regulator n=1 Tax=Paenibacillus sp. HB172176 TaxID=2493690 RepID=UPI00143A3AEF|nr:LacI family DNA-binding transcriptional regulator [Paenibacillus sp. HB172176]
MATVKQIAELLGISNATVSRVLNHDPKISVSEQTRAAIFKTAEEIGYTKKKVNPKIENIALLYWGEEGEELDNIFNESILNEIIDQAKNRNMSLVRYEKRDGIGAVKADMTGFIAIGWFDMEEIEYLKRITRKGVFINTRPDESLFDSVQANQDSMVRQIVDYFVLKGHKSIGFIGGPDYEMVTHKPLMDIREWSFRQTMAYYKLLKEEHVFIAEGFTVKEGYRIGVDAINKLQEEMPTAFCVADDALAIGALQAFNERQWEIPGRVSFFSINDIGIAQYVSPPLTTFRIDISILCSSALDLLMERVLRNRETTKTVYINGTPIFRKSC